VNEGEEATKDVWLVVVAPTLVGAALGGLFAFMPYFFWCASIPATMCIVSLMTLTNRGYRRRLGMWTYPLGLLALAGLAASLFWPGVALYLWLS